MIQGESRSCKAIAAGKRPAVKLRKRAGVTARADGAATGDSDRTLLKLGGGGQWGAMTRVSDGAAGIRCAFCFTPAGKCARAARPCCGACRCRRERGPLGLPEGTWADVWGEPIHGARCMVGTCLECEAVSRWRSAQALRRAGAIETQGEAA